MRYYIESKIFIRVQFTFADHRTLTVFSIEPEITAE